MMPLHLHINKNSDGDDEDLKLCEKSIFVHFIAGEITLVALAPLTNIALAMKLDPDFGKKLKNVTIMGGNIEVKYH